MKEVVLVGSPNSGKTSLFNKLTGNNQKVGNWSGVTVESKKGILKNSNEKTKIIDLPGIHSLNPSTIDEKISIKYLLTNNIDLIINVIDVSNLKKSLLLTFELMELKIPFLIVLSKTDTLDKKTNFNDNINSIFGVKIFEISVNKNKGIDDLINFLNFNQKFSLPTQKIKYNKTTENLINDIAKTVDSNNKILYLAILEKNKYLINHYSKENDEINLLLNDLDEADLKELLVKQRIKMLDEIIIHSKKENTLTDKLDLVLANKYIGIPIFFVIMWFVYFLAIQVVGSFITPPIEEGVLYLSENINTILTQIGLPYFIVGLISEGIIGGVGGVLTFLPSLIILFIMIAFLEASGYMTRITFLLDSLFNKIGLSGKSVIPMIIGSGCSVPAFMSARTIEDTTQRRLTLMLTPFIPCSAKLPVFALFIAAFFPEQAWVAPSMYLIGILTVVVSGLILKQFNFGKSKNKSFIIQLPNYQLPIVANIWRDVRNKIKNFIYKAGTIILYISIILWFMQNYNFMLQQVSETQSMLASIGYFIAPIFTPLGFGTWEASVAVLSGIAAKEVMVSTFGVILNPSSTGLTLTQAIQTIFTPLSAFSFMVFSLLATPCISAISTIYREMNSTKWTVFAIVYQLGIAYLFSFVIFQIGSLIIN